MRRLIAGVVSLATLLLFSIFSSVPALAHTNANPPPSAFWTGDIAMDGFTIHDPLSQLVNQQVEYDYHFTCSGPMVMPYGVGVDVRGLDPDGFPLTPWGGVASFQYSFSQTDCSNLFAAGANHRPAASLPTGCPSAGCAHAELRFVRGDTGAVLGRSKTTSAGETPEPPENLQAVPLDGAVDLIWNASTTSGATYTVERRRPSQVGWDVIVSGHSPMTYSDTTVSNGRTYEYRVKACSGSTNCSVWSNVVTVSTSVTVDPNDTGIRLSCEQGAALMLRAGFPQADLVDMTAIMKEESQFYTHAISYTGCCVGLLQIHLAVWGVSKEAMYDPEENVAEGLNVYHQQGKQAWQAYTGPDAVGSDGPYTKWLSEAETCVAKAVADGGAAADTIINNPQVGEVDQVSDPDSDGSLSCGFSMFCWIKAGLKWAFLPGEATKEAWDSFRTALETRPPFSVVFGGVQFIQEYMDIYDNMVKTITNPTCWSPMAGEIVIGPFCLDQSLDDVAAVSVVDDHIRLLLRLMLWGGLFFWLRRKFGASTGEVQTTEPDDEGA